jgi:hypothetical protein
VDGGDRKPLGIECLSIRPEAVRIEGENVAGE